MAAAKSRKQVGRILRVKHGYNPNSSSMGSIIYALPVSLMAVTAGFTMASSLILTHFLGREPSPQDKADTGPNNDGDSS